MKIIEAIRFSTLELEKIYSEREANNIAAIIMEEITGFNKIERLVNKDFILTISQEKKLNEYLKELLAHKPLQYVLGKTYFYKNQFLVNEYVLIPRPETEELVNLIIKEQQNKQQSIIDIGTGSGCIAISLKKNLPLTNITAIDCSKEALNVATKNAKQLNTEITFLHLDFLVEKNWNNLDFFDIIVSNPPYIKEEEKLSMFKNVLDYEPHVALFVSDNDALVFYRKIIEFSKKFLNPYGCIYVEINESLSLETEHLFKQNNYTTLLIKDLQGKERMLKAW